MNIKVLGPGCAKCHKLEDIVKQVVREMGVDAPVEKVSDMKEITKYPILMTPGLVINDELVVSGKVPDKAEITRYITNALAKE
ncbi:MAG: TM0996/MTH895 family glutaredoxin-like protein [Chloroflexi bacterium]|nr:TM0996/MTH895 family glutaredoxin-like protein [Chloroflexota bacterium]